MKYPTIEEQEEIENNLNSSDVEKIFLTIAKCIKHVFDTTTVYEDSTTEELSAFIENLNKAQFGKIMNFYKTMPSLEHTIKYTCPKCDKKESILLRGIQSFFA
jgi:hypothetical protein